MSTLLLYLALTLRLVTVPAYCPKECCCGRWADGLFASNQGAQGRAVASSTYPFGTRMFIPGYGEVEVKDRGPNVVEVFFESHQDALEWGVKQLVVRIDYAGRTKIKRAG